MALEGHAGGMNFYQKAIFNKNKPWGVIYYPAFAYTLWLAIRYRKKDAILLTCWTLVVYALYTAVKTKLHWYIVPIYPAIAISSAIFLERLLKPRALNFAFAVLLIALLVQVPVSWAFKLDFNPDVKNSALFAEKLMREGAVVYVYNIDDDKEVFYFRDFKPLITNKSNLFVEKRVTFDNAYCIIRARDVAGASSKYLCVFERIASFGPIIIAKLNI